MSPRLRILFWCSTFTRSSVMSTYFIFGPTILSPNQGRHAFSEQKIRGVGTSCRAIHTNFWPGCLHPCKGIREKDCSLDLDVNTVEVRDRSGNDSKHLKRIHDALLRCEKYYSLTSHVGNDWKRWINWTFCLMILITAWCPIKKLRAVCVEN